MPEANVLYSVTGVVLVGLVAWVAMVLKSAKEPWIRPQPAVVTGELASEEAPLVIAPADTSGINADDTARATPVALSDGRLKIEDEKLANDEEKKKSEEA